MKIRRHKHTKRIIKYYKANFHLDTKIFNVLIDGTFAHEALKARINIAEQMPKFFDVRATNCKLFTTKCAIKETEMLGKPTHGAMLILKQYALAECKHKGEFVNTEKCFRSILESSVKSSSGYDMKFFTATQSESMKEIVRSLAGVPLMFISHSAINVEKPSQVSVEQSNQSIRNKLKPRDIEMDALKKLKEKILGSESGKIAVNKVQKKRRPKEPNPLSCKKKTKKPFAPKSNKT